ncbi:hypothetical protein [Carnobacterium alterfunditum]|uniref:hypothetical protein n=1 Tax=Carnobacterium alterfunditum TaxID=28230 RepID=UPI0035939FFB
MIDKSKDHYYLSYGIGFGLMGGSLLAVMMGMFFEFPFIWAIGSGVGILIGVVVGTLMDTHTNHSQKK